jgi:hypothetical protein
LIGATGAISAAHAAGLGLAAAFSHSGKLEHLQVQQVQIDAKNANRAQVFQTAARQS